MLLPENRPAADPEACLLPERRAFVRLASELTAGCRSVTGLPSMSWPGRVSNISRGGLALLLRHRFRPGSRLAVELRSQTGAVLRTVQVRVIHVTPVADHGCHGWQLGCAFNEPLSDEEWQSLT